jgi:Zn-dependent protease
VIVFLWVAAELVASLPHDGLGPIHAAALVTGLLAVSMARELTRALIARWLSSEDDAPSETVDAMIWPLGGLSPAAPLGVRRTLLAELGGVGAGLLLIMPAASLVLLSGAPITALVFDPISPRVTAAELRSPLQVFAWWLYYANAVVLVLNVLLPMLPFDLGRIILSLSRRKRGGMLAAQRTLKLGVGTALAVLVVASTIEQTRMIAVAAVGALATWLEYRRLTFLASPASGAARHAGLRSDDSIDDEVSSGSPRARVGPAATGNTSAASGTLGGLGSGERHGETPTQSPSQRANGPSRPEPIPGRGGTDERFGRSAATPPHPRSGLNLDEILSKISTQGVRALTPEEQEFLSRETRKRRGE